MRILQSVTKRMYYILSASPFANRNNILAAVSAGNERVKSFDSVHLALALYLRDLYQIPFCTKEFNLVNYIIDEDAVELAFESLVSY